jgi:hypothetical protein
LEEEGCDLKHTPVSKTELEGRRGLRPVEIQDST